MMRPGRCPAASSRSARDAPSRDRSGPAPRTRSHRRATPRVRADAGWRCSSRFRSARQARSRLHRGQPVRRGAGARPARATARRWQSRPTPSGGLPQAGSRPVLSDKKGDLWRPRARRARPSVLTPNTLYLYLCLHLYLGLAAVASPRPAPSPSPWPHRPAREWSTSRHRQTQARSPLSSRPDSRS